MIWVILTLLIALGIGTWIATRQASSKWWLNLRMYQHIDEKDATGAKKFEAEHAKRMCEKWGWIVPLDELWWPHPDLAGIMATPHSWRRKLYVGLGFKEEKPWGKPYRKEDIRLITVTWTSEANHDDATMFLAIERGVARALSIPWHEHLFERVDHRPDRDQVSLIVADRPELPEPDAAAILNGRAANHAE